MPPDQEAERRTVGTSQDLMIAVAKLSASTEAFHVTTNEKFADVKADLKDIKDGVKSDIAKHEERLNKLESSRTSQTILISIGTGIMGLLATLLIYHMAK